MVVFLAAVLTFLCRVKVVSGTDVIRVITYRRALCSPHFLLEWLS